MACSEQSQQWEMARASRATSRRTSQEGPPGAGAGRGSPAVSEVRHERQLRRVETERTRWRVNDGVSLTAVENENIAAAFHGRPKLHPALVVGAVREPVPLPSGVAMMTFSTASARDEQ